MAAIILKPPSLITHHYHRIRMIPLQLSFHLFLCRNCQRTHRKETCELGDRHL